MDKGNTILIYGIEFVLGEISDLCDALADTDESGLFKAIVVNDQDLASKAISIGLALFNSRGAMYRGENFGLISAYVEDYFFDAIISAGIRNDIVEKFVDGYAYIISDGSVYIYLLKNGNYVEVMSWTSDEYFEDNGLACQAAIDALEMCRREGVNVYNNLVGKTRWSDVQCCICDEFAKDIIDMSYTDGENPYCHSCMEYINGNPHGI